MEVERRLRPESICDLDEVAVGDPASAQLHGGTHRVRLRTDGGEPNPREMPRGRSIFEKTEALSGQHHEVEIAVAVDIDRRDRTTVVVVVEAQDVRALDEPAIRVVEEAIPFISTERAAKIACLVRHHILKGRFLLDCPCVGDNLSPQERSKVRRIGIPVAGVAVRHEDLFVAVVVDVDKQTAPRPPCFVHAKWKSVVPPRA